MGNKKKDPPSERPDVPAEETELKTEAGADRELGTDTGAEPEPVAETEPAAEPKPVVEPSEADRLRAELAAEHDRYLRILADYDNFRKRSAKEREFIFADVRADTVEKFLPVYDNLERALKQPTTDEAYRKGVELIMNQFIEVLSQFGVKPIEAEGQKFNPELHNAVMHVEDETLGESVIVEEFRKGFLLGDKVIRFSMVKVAN